MKRFIVINAVFSFSVVLALMWGASLLISADRSYKAHSRLLYEINREHNTINNQKESAMFGALISDGTALLNLRNRMLLQYIITVMVCICGFAMSLMKMGGDDKKPDNG